MTNQNDTQDEAERLAEVMIASLVTMNNRPVHRPDVLKYAFKAGYRAGLATVADKRLELAAKYSDLADKYSASRAEVERLKMEIEEAIGGRDQWRKTQLELNAEKARSKKLVEAVKFYVIHIANSDSIDMQLLIDARRSLRDCLRAYSTDSGDGEKG